MVARYDVKFGGDIIINGKSGEIATLCSTLWYSDSLWHIWNLNIKNIGKYEYEHSCMDHTMMLYVVLHCAIGWWLQEKVSSMCWVLIRRWHHSISAFLDTFYASLVIMSAKFWCRMTHFLTLESHFIYIWIPWIRCKGIENNWNPCIGNVCRPRWKYCLSVVSTLT